MSIQDLAEARRRIRRFSDEESNERDARRFKTIVAKKLRTSFIHALAEMEQTFGYIWGHGLDETELNAEQAQARRQWDQMRTRILDCGNLQIRGLQAEVDLHTVKFVGCVTRLRGESVHGTSQQT